MFSILFDNYEFNSSKKEKYKKHMDIGNFLNLLA